MPMELNTILNEVVAKFFSSQEFTTNKELFAQYFNNAGTLALGYIIHQLNGLDLFYLSALDPDYRYIKAKDNENLDFMSDESISRYILNRKSELCEQDSFNQRFLTYLINNRPDLIELIEECSRGLIQIIVGESTNQTIISDKIPLYIINSFSQSDVFEIMSSSNADFLKSKLRNLQAVISDVAIENMALKNEVNKYTKEKPQPITKKANLILLLDFCNEFLKFDPKAKPEKIIKTFEDEKIYYGGWKSWQPFLIENFEIIKRLTKTDFTKKMDGLFAINHKRDQIDDLYAIIEKSKTIK